MYSLSPGDVEHVKVDRISNTGNGIVEFSEGTLNLGPLPQKIVGEVVEVEFLGGSVAYCLEDEYLEAGYASEILQRSSNISLPDWAQIDEGEVLTVEVERFSQTGRPIALYRGRDIVVKNLHIIQYDYTHGSAMYFPYGIEVKVVVTNSDVNLAESRAIEVIDRQEAYLLSEAEEDEQEKVGEGSGPRNTEEELNREVQSANQERVGGELEGLRQRAVEEGEEKPSRESISRSSTSEYSRSSAVKRYVKERADGVCEGCSESAPFVNSAGEPYLHAHHVHELSEGGADVPEAVVALCPNCHYRVHHGKDGVAFNEVLIERVAELEDVCVDEVRELG